MKKIVLLTAWFMIIFCARLSAGGWSFVASMPHGRDWHDAVVGNEGLIYVMGGGVFTIKGKSCSPEHWKPYTVLAYNPKDNTWKYLNPIPGRNHPPSHFYYYDEDKKTWERAKKDSDFDRKTKKWIIIDRPGRFKDFKGKTRDTDFHREGAGVAIIKDQKGNILWLGGMDWGEDSESYVFTYYPSRDEWTEVTGIDKGTYYINDYHSEIPNMLEAKACHGAVMTKDGKIYVIGGWKRVHYDVTILNSVECYDPVSKKWTYKTPMSERKMLSGCTLGPDGKIYVFGGTSEDPGSVKAKPLDTVEVYDPATDKWSLRKPMPARIASLRAVLASNGKIYIIGGFAEDNKPLKTVYVYDPATDKWKRGPNMNVHRQCLAAVATPDGKIYAIGGSNVGIHPMSDVMNTLLDENKYYNGRVQETVEVLDISK